MTTDLRQLLDNVAESGVQSDLARNAVAAASQRRRSRFVVTGSIVATAAVVLGFVVVVQPFAGVTEEAQPVDVAALPAQLPTAEGLPSLEEAPMEAASTAYVIDGEVVFINAKTAEAVKLFPSSEDIPLSLSATAALSSRLSADAGWNRVVLSPDGEHALLTTPSLPTADGRLGDFLYVLDIAAITIERVPDVRVGKDVSDGAWQPQLLAWDSDSKHFMCGCALAGSTPQVLLIPRVPPWYPQTQGTGIDAIDVAPFQVAAGDDGRFIQLEPQGKWLAADYFYDNDPLDGPIATSDLLALSGDVYGHFAEVRNAYFRGVPAQGPAWSIVIDDGYPTYLPTRPTSRPSWREGTAVGVSWAGEDSYIVTVRPADAPPGEPPPPVALDVVVVDAAGNERTLTRTAVGSSVPSFAGSGPWAP